jgi:hypothetical protein
LFEVNVMARATLVVLVLAPSVAHANPFVSYEVRPCAEMERALEHDS